MAGIHTIDLDRPLALGIFLQRPLRDVDMVRAPVGELATRIFVPPAEFIVAAAVAEGHLGRLTEPHVPIEAAGHILDRKGATDRACADAGRHFLDLAEQALVDDVHGPAELVLLSPLLRADEELELRKFFSGGPGELVLFKRERQRLLAEDVLARLQGLDRDLHVPGVGGDDADDVDVGPLEHLAIVAIGIGLALADPHVVLRPLGPILVDVTDGEDVAELSVLNRITQAHRAGSDAGDPGAVIRLLVRKGGRRRGDVRHHAGRGGRRSPGSGSSKKTSPCRANAIGHGRCSWFDVCFPSTLWCQRGPAASAVPDMQDNPMVTTRRSLS